MGTLRRGLQEWRGAEEFGGRQQVVQGGWGWMAFRTQSFLICSHLELEVFHRRVEFGIHLGLQDKQGDTGV